LQGSFSFKSTFEYDTQHNMTHQYDYGPAGMVRQIDKTYVTTTPFSDAHIWGRPASETILQQPQGTQIARTEWQYDTESLVSRSGTIPGWASDLLCYYVDDELVCPPRANVTKIKRWLNTTSAYSERLRFIAMGSC
jgi:hypothetical protein